MTVLFLLIAYGSRNDKNILLNVSQYWIIIENYVETTEGSRLTEWGNFTGNITYHIKGKLFSDDLLV